MTKKLSITGLCNVLIFCPMISVAGDIDFLELSLSQLSQLSITTASRIEEPINETEASVTVIERHEILKSGARNLYEVLQTVPGISIEYGASNLPIITIRGIRKSTGPDNIQFLLNGHSLTGVISNSASRLAIPYLPMENIQRIEIVKGPGSALYGANAVTAVINIITLTANDEDKTIVSASSEQENNGNIGQTYNIYSAFQSESISTNFNVSIQDFDGPSRSIDGNAFGQSGEVGSAHDAIDLQAQLESNDWKVMARYAEFTRAPYLNLTNVISDDSEHAGKHMFLNASKLQKLNSSLDVTLTGYYDQREGENYNELFPAEIIPSSGSPLSPWSSSGRINRLIWTATRTGFDSLFNYTGIDKHQLLGGIFIEEQRTKDVRHEANYNPGPLPEVIDVSDTFNWNRNESRTLWAIYLQDIWKINSKLKLKAGGRYDHYSDFGGNFNPRLGLFWKANETYQLKFSYATAFRAPDFGDLYVMNFAPISGNENLEPEELTSYETALNIRFSQKMKGSINYFINNYEKLITIPPGSTLIQNFGEINTNGTELEFNYDLGNGNYMQVGYGHVQAEDENGNRLANIPSNTANLLANWAITTSTNWNVTATWQDESSRELADSRESLSAYTLINTTLRVVNLWHAMSLDFSIYNLADEDYAYPASESVPNDYRAAGRSYRISLTIEL